MRKERNEESQKEKAKPSEKAKYVEKNEDEKGDHHKEKKKYVRVDQMT